MFSVYGCHTSTGIRYKNPGTLGYSSNCGGGLLYQLVRTIQEQHGVVDTEIEDVLEEHCMDLDVLMQQKTSEETQVYLEKLIRRMKPDLEQKAIEAVAGRALSKLRVKYWSARGQKWGL